MHNSHLIRRSVLCMSAAIALWACAASSVWAQNKTVLRISSPAVPDDWHGKMWSVFKDALNKSAPDAYEVQINLNGALFKQGTEPTAMARGNLEMASISAFDIAKQVPEFSVFTAGYVIRDPKHQQKVFNSPLGDELFKTVSDKMGVTVLATAYLGTRELNLRDTRTVNTPADLKGVKLRMPGSKEWIFLGNALGASATPLAFGEVYMGLKTGTIDGQDNPLPTTRAAKFYEVTQQVVLTHHLVDSLFIVIANKTWLALSAAEQAKVKAAAVAAVKFNNDNRVSEEAQLLTFFQKQGLKISKPNVDAFRQAVQSAYSQSDMAQHWPKDLVQRINAIK